MRWGEIEMRFREDTLEVKHPNIKMRANTEWAVMPTMDYHSFDLEADRWIVDNYDNNFCNPKSKKFENLVNKGAEYSQWHPGKVRHSPC